MADRGRNMQNLSNAHDISPEFVDCPNLERIFGIRRSLAYELIKRNAIRSVSLRKRGALRGKRLFDVQSVREFLHRQGAESPGSEQTVGHLNQEVSQ